MAWTLRHGSGTGLTPGGSVDDSLAGVHQTPQLGSTPLHHFWEPDASIGNGHPTNLFRTQDSELNPFDLPDRSLRVPGVDRRHDADLTTSFVCYYRLESENENKTN